MDSRFSAPRRLAALVGTAALAGLVAPQAAGQTAEPSYQRTPYEHDSGWARAQGSGQEVVISFPVIVDGASSLRLYFDDITLGGDIPAGTGAKLRITSYLDGAVQEMNSVHAWQWQNSSAYFNGNAVQVEVIAHPNTTSSRVVLGAVDAGMTPIIPKSQCGPVDDRVLSSDPRAGRLQPTGCTAWLIDDCAKCFLTAGHCTGNISVVQFNVPLSSGSGSLNHPPPSDQYAIDASSLQSNGGGGVGNDYAYFGTFANSTTGLTAAQAAGSTFVLVNPPSSPSGQTIRITGYGTDNTPSTHNQVQQTHTGPMVTSSGTTVQYQTDTTGGNSGSPVIWENTGQAIGIHTHGGCQTSGSGANSGTGSNIAGLQNYLANPQGICNAAGSISSNPPIQMTPGVPTPVMIQITGAPVPGSVELRYRLNGGSYTSVVMNNQGGGAYASNIPAAACGDNPEFYFIYQDATCGPVSDPSAAPGSVYSAFVGTLTTSFSDDFQTNQGWTQSVAGATSGNWQRGVPVNDPNWAYDPTSDGDGSGQAYVTQNQLGNTDVDNGSVTLTSPVIDMSGGSAMVSYLYYLNLTDEDGTDRLLVQHNGNGGAGAWTTIATHDTDGGTSWRSHSISSSALASAGANLTANSMIRFIANDGDTQSIVEAGVDGFEVAFASCGGGGCLPPQNYCTAKLNSNLALPSIASVGQSSVSGNNFKVNVSNAIDNKAAIYFYGLSAANIPFQGGFLCAQPPTVRGGVIQTDGSGFAEWTVDISGRTPGNKEYFQIWSRDPADPAGFGTSLTGGLEVTYCN